MNNDTPSKLVMLARRLAFLQTREADAALARKVATFQGDINANATYVWEQRTDPLLAVVAPHYFAPLTLAALAARGDVDVYRFDACGTGQVVKLLAAFPALDVNVPCNEDGERPLALMLRTWPTAGGLVIKVHALACVQALLDAGSEIDAAPHWKAAIADDHQECMRLCVKHYNDPQLAALIAPHTLWVVRLRSVWTVACVALASGAAEPPPLPRSGLCCILTDTLRVCIAPGPGQGSHQLLSEYAGMVAAFL